MSESDNEEEDAYENEESDDINSDKGEEQSVSQNTPWKHSELSMLIAALKRIKRLKTENLNTRKQTPDQQSPKG